MNITFSKTTPLLGGVIVAEFVKSTYFQHIDISWSNESTTTIVKVDSQEYHCKTSNDVARIIVRKCAESQLYGSDNLQKTEVDHWFSYALTLTKPKVDITSHVDYLNRTLVPLTYLVGKRITVADFVVFAALFENQKWQALLKDGPPESLLRWYNNIKSFEAVNKAIEACPLANVALSNRSSNRVSPPAGTRAQEGKFVDLPGAEMGKVVVRFPPEASGYLHIGHAKAALLNQYYQQAFQGKLIMRFDDTNPAKENVHFEKVILEDIEMLEIKPDLFTHTSQYFDIMLEYCEKLLKEGKAYADDTEPELMKQQREQKTESANRNNTYKQNLELWEEMKKGTEKGQKCCIRAKIDMQSPNGCMRDPTIYRCKNEPHPRTGNTYKVYPTYDFACPIVDAIENVTHTLRTMEYHDRDVQFYWFIDALGLRKPIIWEYSRLSMTNTVLSKRKLTWFVENHLVDGWDDPRFPTVRGVLRRGMTVEGLKQFIIAQGSSRSVVFMEWDKIWAFNKKVIDPIAPRYTTIDFSANVPVLIKGVKDEKVLVPKHPKNSELGMKEIWIGSKVLIDLADAELLKEGENTTFINWGNVMINKIKREKDKIVSIEATPNLENKDYKKTLKITWLTDTDSAPLTPVWCVYFDHIISKPLLTKDEDFKQYVGHETKQYVRMLGDDELKKLKKGDIIQLQRRGFFKVDEVYSPLSLNTGIEGAVVLFSIPDGHTKENPTAGVPKNEAASQKASKASSVILLKDSINSEDISIDINNKIIAQGDKIRNLKAAKADKNVITTEVKILLDLKGEYKQITGKEWKPTESGTPSASKNISKSGSGDDIIKINNKIIAQGDKVRNLKAAKAGKDVITGEVKILLDLKAEFKQITGKEWKPAESTEIPGSGDNNVDIINNKIVAQGDKIRNLKTSKADKNIITAEVKILLDLKGEYKQIVGKEWKPTESGTPSAGKEVSKSGSGDSSVDINNKIVAQGDKVRTLKAAKAGKDVITSEVKILLDLKAEFKQITGKEWKPAAETPSGSKDISKPKDKIDAEQKNFSKEKKFGEVNSEQVHQICNARLENESNNFEDSGAALNIKIKAQGEKVRNLKTNKADKDVVTAEVNILLNLKSEYKQATGKDWKPAENGDPSVNKDASKNTKAKEDKVSKQKKVSVPKEKKSVETDDSNNTLKKQTRLGLEAKKEENLPDWYSQVITKGELIEYYDVSGCYILRPWSYTIWEAIKDWFDTEIKKLGVENCSFPIFVSRAALEKEKTHIADFSPEVAWVTKSGDSDMAEPVAIRPTSETAMYPAYAKWVQSYRDLPIKLNQWNNVVRWEFKHPQPFLRTREFLWQEGHTAYANKDDACQEVSTILDLYAKIYTDLLAIPVIKGRKTEKEKFAGGDYTLTIEAFISATGRGIQAATSHHLGQNFSKMFEIIFDHPETQEKTFVYQNSWGITTRTIGVMVMVHADNQGLVLPPHVASIQAVIVPCGVSVNLSETERNELQMSCDNFKEELLKAGVRVKGDYRDNYSPGWKFNHWELKGVPVRIEIGPKDIKNKQVVAVRRDTGQKITLKRESAVQDLKELLENIQQNLFNRASEDFTKHTVQLNDWKQFTPTLDKKNVILAPFCGEIGCEDQIKADSTRDASEVAEVGAPSMGAKSLCIPLEQPSLKANTKCIHPECKNMAKFYTLFGRSY